MKLVSASRQLPHSRPITPIPNRRKQSNSPVKVSQSTKMLKGIVESTVRIMLFKIIMETTDQIYFLEDDAMATCRDFLDKFIAGEC